MTLMDNGQYWHQFWSIWCHFFLFPVSEFNIKSQQPSVKWKTKDEQSSNCLFLWIQPATSPTTTSRTWKMGENIGLTILWTFYDGLSSVKTPHRSALQSLHAVHTAMQMHCMKKWSGNGKTLIGSLEWLHYALQWPCAEKIRKQGECGSVDEVVMMEQI